MPGRAGQGHPAGTLSDVRTFLQLAMRKEYAHTAVTGGHRLHVGWGGRDFSPKPGDNSALLFLLFKKNLLDCNTG